MTKDENSKCVSNSSSSADLRTDDTKLVRIARKLSVVELKVLFAKLSERGANPRKVSSSANTEESFLGLLCISLQTVREVALCELREGAESGVFFVCAIAQNKKYADSLNATEQDTSLVVR